MKKNKFNLEADRKTQCYTDIDAHSSRHKKNEKMTKFIKVPQTKHSYKQHTHMYMQNGSESKNTMKKHQLVK